MGINNLLTMEHLFGPKALVEQHHQLGDISNIINVIASTAFIFLPALIGWSSMKVLEVVHFRISVGVDINASSTCFTI